MATTKSSYDVISIGDRAADSEDDRVYVRLRADLDIGAFGASAAYQKKAGEAVVTEHDEIGRRPTGTRSCTSSSRAVRRSPSTATRSKLRRAPSSSSATPPRNGRQLPRPTARSCSRSADVAARRTAWPPDVL
jgi:hypothetical protein